MRRRSFPRGAYIWHAGDLAIHACVLVNGVVKFLRPTRDGSELVVDFRLPGGTFGEYHLFEKESRRSFDAVVVERCECLVIARDSLRYHLERNPQLTWQIAAALLRSSNRNFESLALHRGVRDVTSRVQRLLRELAATHGEPTPEGRRIRFRLDQSMLAGYVGASRENVNRALSGLAHDRVISTEDGHITVHPAAGARAREAKPVR